MVGIVDYGMGNLLSVYNAFDYIGEEVQLCTTPEDLSTSDRIVIPGVGAFSDCIEKLRSTGFVDALNEHVIDKGKPTLGICLGMQVMASKSYEMGEFEGLNWFDAEVVKLTPEDPTARVPNVGWNEVNYKEGSEFFAGTPQEADFYFVHSYYVRCNNSDDVEATYQF
jgi:glutamine amidotransferase